MQEVPSQYEKNVRFLFSFIFALNIGLSICVFRTPTHIFHLYLASRKTIVRLILLLERFEYERADMIFISFTVTGRENNCRTQCREQGTANVEEHLAARNQ